MYFQNMLRFSLVIFSVSLVRVSLQDASVGDTCKFNDGTPGTCRSLLECQEVQISAARGQVPQPCGFLNGVPIVCCTSREESTTEMKISPTVETVTIAELKPVDHSKSFQKCREYAEAAYVIQPPISAFDKPKKVLQCGFKIKPLVVGGMEAKLKEFPHMASLGYEFRNEVRWACGGSLISENFILTAAHCVKPNKSPKFVHLGLINLNDRNKTGALQEFNVVDVFRHEGYFKNGLKYNDIALLKMDRSAVFTPFVRPACLHTQPQISNEAALGVGWGLDANEDEVSDLMYVRLTIIPQAKCNESYINKKRVMKYLSRGIDATSQLCAGDPGKDTCQGDSGGPLQVYRLDVDCMYDIIGVTSLGLICGESPGVYTMLPHYIPWIEGIVWP